MISRAAYLSILGFTVVVTGCISEVDSGQPDPTQEAANPIVQCATPQRECTPTDTFSTQGIEYCVEDDQGAEQWTACCGFSTADCECKPPWAGPDWQCNTPLVLSFNDEAVRYSTNDADRFDLSGVGSGAVMDWPTAATPWIALDRDGDGGINDGGELFGTATRVGEGQRAPNGFYALGRLDDNADGVIDARDAAFARLSIWRDANADRQSQPSEIAPMSSEVSSISLAYTVDSRCDARGNCEVERAPMRFIDDRGRAREGRVIDVHLAAQ